LHEEHSLLHLETGNHDKAQGRVASLLPENTNNTVGCRIRQFVAVQIKPYNRRISLHLDAYVLYVIVVETHVGEVEAPRPGV
jgi:hypothetical protein